jgi:peptide/nickel transport system substrate-binding protein
VKEGLPVSKTLDWVDLSFEPQITVPADVWVDWDAANQKFITAGEKFPDGLTANVRSTVYYPEDLFTVVKWQDGSPLSAADFVMNIIQVFDRPNLSRSMMQPRSTLEGYLSHSWVCIVPDPLVIETYDDPFCWANHHIAIGLSQPTWWRNAHGVSAWHTRPSAFWLRPTRNWLSPRIKLAPSKGVVEHGQRTQPRDPRNISTRPKAKAISIRRHAR